MIPVRIVQLNPIALRYLWEKFDSHRELFGDELAKDQIEFCCWLAAADVQIFSVGESDTNPFGVFIFSDIVPNVSAVAHIFMWDREKYKYADLIDSARFVIKSMMRTFNLQRVSGLTPTALPRAFAMAKRVGFKEEGRVRKACSYHGEWIDGWLTGILREEAEALSPESQKEAV